jgi:hypothetical protein
VRQIILEIEKEKKNSGVIKKSLNTANHRLSTSIYLQKWFAGDTKKIELTVEKKD